MFDEITRPLELFKDFKGNFWIAGGWAVDLFLGHKSRDHEDIEIAISRHDLTSLKDLDDISYITYVDNKQIKDWKGEKLVLPIHEMNCHFKNGEMVEVLLNEFDNDYWLYRRNLKIRMLKDKLSVQTGSYLPIEIVLLFKSKDMRDIDQHDFMNSVKVMSNDQKIWLYEAILIDFPNHPWLSLLG